MALLMDPLTTNTTLRRQHGNSTFGILQIFTIYKSRNEKKKKKERLNVPKLRLDLLLKGAVLHNILNYNFKITRTVLAEYDCLRVQNLTSSICVK